MILISWQIMYLGISNLSFLYLHQEYKQIRKFDKRWMHFNRRMSFINSSFIYADNMHFFSVYIYTTTNSYRKLGFVTSLSSLAIRDNVKKILLFYWKVLIILQFHCSSEILFYNIFLLSIWIRWFSILGSLS